MTVERKILFGLDDIQAISFQCDKCKYRVTMSPDEVRAVPEVCPSGHQWVRGAEEGIILTPLLGFSRALANLRVLMGQKVLGFKVILEFEEPRASQ